MRIAFVVPSLQSGGAERMVATLANFYSKKWEVMIVTLLQKEIFYDLSPSIKIKHVRDFSPSQNKSQAIFKNLLTIKNLIRVLKKEEINLVISFTTTANVLSTIASTRVGLPNIISERNNSIVNPPNWFWRKLRNYIYKYASILVVQTEGNKKIFSSIIPSSKIKIIENAVSERLETSFNEINFNKPNLSRLNILTVGRLNENKAHHIGLKALSQLTDYPWHYTVVGNGPLKQKLIGLCNSLGIKNRVTFTGNIKNVEDYYKNSDIFIFTSRSEGFPNALMEAYYFGIPCLSTNCDYGPSDIIQNGIDGFLTPVDDVNLLKNKLKTLIEDKNLRISISKVAQKNSKRFHIENVAKKWETLIKSCTGSQN